MMQEQREAAMRIAALYVDGDTRGFARVPRLSLVTLAKALTERDAAVARLKADAEQMIHPAEREVVQLRESVQQLEAALEWCKQAAIDIGNAPTEGTHVPRRTELRDAAVGIASRAHHALTPPPAQEETR